MSGVLHLTESGPYAYPLCGGPINNESDRTLGYVMASDHTIIYGAKGLPTCEGCKYVAVLAVFRQNNRSIDS